MKDSTGDVDSFAVEAQEILRVGGLNGAFLMASSQQNPLQAVVQAHREQTFMLQAARRTLTF